MFYNLLNQWVSDGDILDVLYEPVEETPQHRYGVRQVVVISVERGYLWGLNLTSKLIMMKVLSTDIFKFKDGKAGLYEAKDLIDYLYKRRNSIMRSRFRRYKISNIISVKKSIYNKVVKKPKQKYSQKAISKIKESMARQIEEKKKGV